MPSARKVFFAGKTPEDEEIILYVDEPNEKDFVLTRPSKRLPPRPEYFIKRPDGETWAISPGSTMVTWEDTDWFGTIYCIRIESPEWTGTAKGTRKDLIRAEGTHP